MVIRQERSGVAVIPGIAPDFQCGTLGQKAFNYKVSLEVDRLDERGFVCDNAEIPAAINRYFEVGRWQGSCEQLAVTIIDIVKGLCNGRAIKVAAEINPFPNAYLTMTWSAYDDPADLGRVGEGMKRLDEPKPARHRKSVPVLAN